MSTNIAPGMSDLARIWNTQESALTPHLSRLPNDATNPFTSRARKLKYIPPPNIPLAPRRKLPVTISTQTRENGRCENVEIPFHSSQISESTFDYTSDDSNSLPDAFTQLLLEAETAIHDLDYLQTNSIQYPARTKQDSNNVGMSYESDEIEVCLRASTGEPPLVTLQPYSRHWKRSGVYQWRKPTSVVNRHDVDRKEGKSWRKVKGVKKREIERKKTPLRITPIYHNTELLELPNELLSLILSYLPLSSLLSLSQSCKRLNFISNSPFLYSHLNLSRLTVSTDNLNWIISKQPKHFICYKSSISLTDSQTQLLFQGIAPYLQSIHLYPGTPYTLKGDQVCHLLSQHATHSLTCVKLNWVGVTDHGLSYLSSLHSLIVLSLAGANHVTDQAIIPLLLKFQATLESLDISSCIQLTNKTGFVVATCQNLSFLNLGTCYKFTDRAFKLILSSLHQIENLDLHSNPGLAETDSSVLEGLNECCKLKNLNISHAYNIQDSHLMHLLEKWPDLEELHVKNCKLTDGFISALSQARLTKLTHLDVSGLPISPFGLSTLITSYQLSITSLSLNSCPRITQKGVLRLIERCQKLETVSVFDTKIYPVPNYLNKSKVKIIGATPLPPTLSRNINK